MTTPARPAGLGGMDFFCNTSSLARSLRWLGVLAGSGAPLNLTDEDNFANTDTLYIAPRSLPVGATAVLTFTACYANALPDPSLCGTATTSFSIQATPLLATLSGVNAIVGAAQEPRPVALYARRCLRLPPVCGLPPQGKSKKPLAHSPLSQPLSSHGPPPPPSPPQERAPSPSSASAPTRTPRPAESPSAGAAPAPTRPPAASRAPSSPSPSPPTPPPRRAKPRAPSVCSALRPLPSPRPAPPRPAVLPADPPAAEEPPS